MDKMKKAKIKDAVEFVKSFAFGYCLTAGVLVTALVIKAKKEDTHLEWVSNK